MLVLHLLACGWQKPGNIDWRIEHYIRRYNNDQIDLKLPHSHIRAGYNVSTENKLVITGRDRRKRSRQTLRENRWENSVWKSTETSWLFPHLGGLSGTFLSISDHGSPILGPEKCLNEFSITCWACFANYILAPSLISNLDPNCALDQF